MRLKNAGRGIHQRELAGTESLLALPPDWYGFSNLELSLSAGQSREIDAVLVIADRILLVDWKDWYGRIESADGRWLQNGQDRGRSAVVKIRENARKLAEVLREYLTHQARRKGQPTDRIGVPWVQGCVVLTAKPRPNVDGVAENERTEVFHLDDFIRNLLDPTLRNRAFGTPSWIDRSDPLTAKAGRWRQSLGSFFNVQTGPFRPQARLYGGHRALADETSFKHPGGIYSEYEAEEDAPGRAQSLLRLWDFSQAAERFQVEAGRAEIAGREQAVIAFLKDRGPEFDALFLQPKVSEPERSVGYWEVFEKRQRLRRLSELSRVDTGFTSSIRVDLAGVLLAGVSAMHDLDAAHLDLGGHSIWIEAPATVRISHLLAASFPSVESLGEHRYRFLAAPIVLPEDCLDEPSTPKQRDIFLLGVAVHRLRFGVTPDSRPGDAPEWSEEVDADGKSSALYGWFEQALEFSPGARFPDAGAALSAFNAALATGNDDSEVFARLDRFRIWPDQLALLEALPPIQTLRRSHLRIVWQSERDGQKVIVKFWRRAGWGDVRAEAPRILRFLERADDLAGTPPAGVAPVLQAAFLDDAIVLVQSFVAGTPLDGLDEDTLRGATEALAFIAGLIGVIRNLHELGLFHGDLKPANIIVSQTDSGPQPVLIDLLGCGDDLGFPTHC